MAAGENSYPQLLLNMQMLLDDLEDDFTILYARRYRDAQRLAGARIYFGQADPDPAYVYVAQAEVFDSCPIQNTAVCRISVGPLQRQGDPPYSLLEIDGTLPWQKVFTAVQEIFHRYLSWSYRLAHILNHDGGLYELCVAAQDFFRNPLYIHDENFNFLAMPTWVVGMPEIQVDENTGNITVPLTKIQQFNSNAAYIRSLLTRGAQLWVSPWGPHRSLYANIWLNSSQYCGRFLINELNTILKPSHYLMANYFVEILSIAFERNLFKSDNTLTFEAILRQILAGDGVDEHYLLERLQMVGWRRNDRFICFKIQLDQKKPSLISSQKIRSTVGIVLKKSFSFSVDTAIYTVCNLSLAGYGEALCHSKMRDFCEAATVTVGTSFPFRDFLLFKDHCRQAEKAIALGKNISPGKRYFPFSDYVLNYIIEHFTQEFSPSIICSQAVLQLHEIDREKGTQFIRTLQCYFHHCCQQTATAQELFIHRSTLNYRLEKIQELTGMDLNDEDMRLYLQLSLRLLCSALD